MQGQNFSNTTKPLKGAGNYHHCHQAQIAINELEIIPGDFMQLIGRARNKIGSLLRARHACLIKLPSITSIWHECAHQGLPNKTPPRSRSGLTAHKENRQPVGHNHEGRDHGRSIARATKTHVTMYHKGTCLLVTDTIILSNKIAD